MVIDDSEGGRHAGGMESMSLRPSGDPMIGVALAVGVRLYRDGLVAALAAFPELAVVAAVGETDALLESLGGCSADVVLLDASLAAGLSTIRELRRMSPPIPVLALGIVDRERDVLASVEAGAAGYVTRDATIDELVMSIESAVRGEARVTPQLVGTLLRRIAILAADSPGRAVERLTEREREIVRLIERGLSNKEIATQLSISVSTVKNHVHSILEKMSVRRRGEVAARLRASAYAPLLEGERS
jgi:DNA-binding NarL/FixJ family response regulator